MNFLAHIYLSNDNDMITIGNFIADGIRGKKYLEFNQGIQTGILLHREIDTFTDSHSIVKQSKRKLYENHGHYAGVIVDILYDHFLAKNWQQYSQVELPLYIQNFYALLHTHYEILPRHTQQLMPSMITKNWLLNYASIEGIQRVLKGMDTRTKNKSNMALAITELKTFYTEFDNEFIAFFDALILFSKEKLYDLQTKK